MTTSAVNPAAVLERKGGGLDLFLEIAAAQLVDNPHHIFTDKITAADERDLKTLAGVSRAILSDSNRAEQFSAEFSRGNWAAAADTAAFLAETAKAAAATAFSHALVLLYAPACAVDAFAVSVVTGGKADRAAYNSRRPTRITADLINFLSASPTREGLIKASVYASVSWCRDASCKFDLVDEANRRRFERFSGVLGRVAQVPDAYSKIMVHVAKEDWAAANDAAIRLLDGGRGGQTVDDPPALADALIVSLLPVCHTDATVGIIAGAAH